MNFARNLLAITALSPLALVIGCATGVPEPQAPPQSNRLQIPQLLPPPDTTDSTDTANSRLALPTTGAATENTTPNIAAEPQVATQLTTPPSQVKPHHRTDNISVVIWRAERGHVPSQLQLGQAYANGNDLQQNLELAQLWLELASVQGDRTAQYELGQMYFSGSGVTKDYGRTHDWWLESATNGNAEAQQKLGYLYSEGIGVPQDYNQAKDWYTKAANLGNAEAQTLLGSLYHEGNRITPDYPQAVKWYRMAAEQGHPHAQYTLGILHHDGLGAEQDYIKCAAWVEVAQANNYPDDLDAGTLCRSKLDEQSNAAADALASLWKTRYLPQ